MRGRHHTQLSHSSLDLKKLFYIHWKHMYIHTVCIIYTYIYIYIYIYIYDGFIFCYSFVKLHICTILFEEIKNERTAMNACN